MTIEENLTSGMRLEPIKYWIPVILFSLTIIGVVASSSSKFQKVTDKALDNADRIGRIEGRNDRRFSRIEDKLDILIKKRICSKL